MFYGQTKRRGRSLAEAASFIFPSPNFQIPGISSCEFLGSADVFGAVGFSTAVAADNGRFVTEAFDALFVFLGLESTHMHFVLFDITFHNVLHSLFLAKADLDPLCRV
jgi:hypothetical protein